MDWRKGEKNAGGERGERRREKRGMNVRSKERNEGMAGEKRKQKREKWKRKIRRN